MVFAATKYAFLAFVSFFIKKTSEKMMRANKLKV